VVNIISKAWSILLVARLLESAVAKAAMDSGVARTIKIIDEVEVGNTKICS